MTGVVRILFLVAGVIIGAVISAFVSTIAAMAFIEKVLMRGQPLGTDGPGDGLLFLMMIVIGILFGSLLGGGVALVLTDPQRPTRAKRLASNSSRRTAAGRGEVEEGPMRKLLVISSLLGLAVAGSAYAAGIGDGDVKKRPSEPVRSLSGFAQGHVGQVGDKPRTQKDLDEEKQFERDMQICKGC